MKAKNHKDRSNRHREALCTVSTFRNGSRKKQVVSESETNRYSPRHFRLIIDLLRMVIVITEGNRKPRRIDANTKGIRGLTLWFFYKTRKAAWDLFDSLRNRKYATLYRVPLYPREHNPVRTQAEKASVQ